MKTSTDLVECPTVNTWHRLPSSFGDATGDATGDASGDATADATADAPGGAAGRRAARRRGALRGLFGSAADEPADALSRHEQEFIVEPGVGLEPGNVAR